MTAINQSAKRLVFILRAVPIISFSPRRHTRCRPDHDLEIAMGIGVASVVASSSVGRALKTTDLAALAAVAGKVV
jgi:hypothetical protein